MVSVLSALYTDRALKVPSLTQLEDPIGKWWTIAPRDPQTTFPEAQDRDLVPRDSSVNGTRKR